MSLKDTIHQDLTAAMKKKDAPRLSTLRMVKSELLKREKEGGRTDGVSDDEALSILQSMIKQRKDAIQHFDGAGRTELADKERSEIDVIQTYLPPEVTVEEIREVVTSVIDQVGASSAKDLGKVMGKAMGELKKSGKTVDGTRVREAAAELLG